MTSLVDGCTRLYAKHGRTAHLQMPGDTYADVYCRIDPPPAWWLGTGSQAEYDRAALLPSCRRCLIARGDVGGPQNIPAGLMPRTLSSREPNAAQEARPRSSAVAAPGAPIPSARGNTALPVAPVTGRAAQERADGTAATPAVPSAHEPVPATPPAGAEGGRDEPFSPAPSRARNAAPSGGEPGSLPPDGESSEGSAAPGLAHPGAAQATRLAPEGDAGRAQDREPGAATPARGTGFPPPATGRAGGAPDRASALPADHPPGLSGQEARDAWRKARSAQAATGRTRRGRYPARRAGNGYRPGLNRRQPPGGGAA